MVQWLYILPQYHVNLIQPIECKESTILQYLFPVLTTQCVLRFEGVRNFLFVFVDVTLSGKCNYTSRNLFITEDYISNRRNTSKSCWCICDRQQHRTKNSKIYIYIHRLFFNLNVKSAKISKAFCLLIKQIRFAQPL